MATWITIRTRTCPETGKRVCVNQRYTRREIDARFNAIFEIDKELYIDRYHLVRSRENWRGHVKLHKAMEKRIAGKTSRARANLDWLCCSLSKELEDRLFGGIYGGKTDFGFGKAA